MDYIIVSMNDHILTTNTTNVSFFSGHKGRNFPGLWTYNSRKGSKNI